MIRRTAVDELNGPVASVVNSPNRGELRLLVGVPYGITLNILKACAPNVRLYLWPELAGPMPKGPPPPPGPPRPPPPPAEARLPPRPFPPCPLAAAAPVFGPKPNVRLRRRFSV